MKSFELIFNRIKANEPYWSSYNCFRCAALGRGFSRKTIRLWFYKLVDKNDYAQKDVKQILANLEEVTKSARGGNETETLSLSEQSDSAESISASKTEDSDLRRRLNNQF